MIWGIQWLEDSCCREGETFWLQIQSSAIKALSTGIHSCQSFVITKQNETHCTHGEPGVLAKGPPVLVSVLPKSRINQPLACTKPSVAVEFVSGVTKQTSTATEGLIQANQPPPHNHGSMNFIAWLMLDLDKMNACTVGFCKKPRHPCQTQLY